MDTAISSRCSAPDNAPDSAPQSSCFSENEPASDAVKRPILELIDLKKIHRTASHELTVLREVNFRLAEGDTCAIVGPSGSGKSLLLRALACLDEPQVCRGGSDAQYKCLLWLSIRQWACGKERQRLLLSLV